MILVYNVDEYPLYGLLCIIDEPTGFCIYEDEFNIEFIYDNIQ